MPSDNSASEASHPFDHPFDNMKPSFLERALTGKGKRKRNSPPDAQADSPSPASQSRWSPDSNASRSPSSSADGLPPDRSVFPSRDDGDISKKHALKLRDRFKGSLRTFSSSQSLNSVALKQATPEPQHSPNFSPTSSPLSRISSSKVNTSSNLKDSITKRGIFPHRRHAQTTEPISEQETVVDNSESAAVVVPVDENHVRDFASGPKEPETPHPSTLSPSTSSPLTYLSTPELTHSSESPTDPSPKTPTDPEASPSSNSHDSSSDDSPPNPPYDSPSSSPPDSPSQVSPSGHHDIMPQLHGAIDSHIARFSGSSDDDSTPRIIATEHAHRSASRINSFATVNSFVTAMEEPPDSGVPVADAIPVAASHSPESEFESEQDWEAQAVVDWIEEFPLVHNSDEVTSSVVTSLTATDALPQDCCERDPDTLPIRVSMGGPPELSTDLRKGVMVHKYDILDNSWEPAWKMEPDIAKIANVIRPFTGLCGLGKDIDVKFLAAGLFNKVYIVSSTDKDSKGTKECIFRCALPDFPWYRTQIEVSTMEYVRHNTTIPVPKIYAFDSSMDNELGLEWILMEKVQGTTYADAQSKMTFEAKVELHKTVADWVDQLSRIQFDTMGSLYHSWNNPLSDKDSYHVGPLNDDEFVSDLRLDFNLDRGPFESKKQYTSSRIAFAIAETQDLRMEERARYWAPILVRRELFWTMEEQVRKAKSAKLEREQEEEAERVAKEKYMEGRIRPKPIPEEWKVLDGLSENVECSLNINEDMESLGDQRYDLESLKEMPRYLLKLQSCLPIIFGREQFEQGSCWLHHGDIHEWNIIVDDDGKAVALLDWEKASSTPFDWVSRYPKIIDTADYDEPEPWTTIGPMDEDTAWEWEQWGRVLLRETFDERLEQLQSPFLKEREEYPEELEAIDNSLAFAGSWKDREFIPNLKARLVRKLV